MKMNIIDCKNLGVLGCGYIGLEVAKLWTSKGFDVTGTTTSQDKYEHMQTYLYEAIQMEGNQLAAMKFFARYKEAILISVAPTRQGISYEEVVAPCLSNLLSTVESNTHLIFLSSTSVYGDTKGEWVNEDSTRVTTPVTLAEDYLLNSLNPLTILRFGGLHGEGRNVFASMAGATVPFTGDRYVNWTHQQDAINSIEFVREKRLLGVYNVVSDCNQTLQAQTMELGITWGSRPGKSVRVSNEKIKQAGFVYDSTLTF